MSTGFVVDCDSQAVTPVLQSIHSPVTRGNGAPLAAFSSRPLINNV